MNVPVLPKSLLASILHEPETMVFQRQAPCSSEKRTKPWGRAMMCRARSACVNVPPCSSARRPQSGSSHDVSVIAVSLGHMMAVLWLLLILSSWARQGDEVGMNVHECSSAVWNSLALTTNTYNLGRRCNNLWVNRKIPSGQTLTCSPFHPACPVIGFTGLLMHPVPEWWTCHSATATVSTGRVSVVGLVVASCTNFKPPCDHGALFQVRVA